jgi:hypothetical protein
MLKTGWVELSKFLILTNSLGWTLKYEGVVETKRFWTENKAVIALFLLKNRQFTKLNSCKLAV